MTGDQTAISYGGTPLYQRLARAVHDLTATVVGELAKQLPVYRFLPSEQLGNDIFHMTEQALRDFVEVLRTGRLPTPDQLAAVRESAAVRAEEGVPLAAVISAYHVGARVSAERMNEAAGPEDLSAAFAAHELLLRYLELMTSSVCAGYAMERQTAFGEEYLARQDLLSALLDGPGALEAVRRTGVRLPAGYLVLSLAFGPHPDELSPGVNNAVAARRKVRRLRVELERHVAGVVLSTLAVDGGIALVPRDTPADATTDKDWLWLSQVIGYMRQVAGVDVTAGVAAADPDGVAEAARLAAEVREVATTFGHPPGMYRLTDVAFEFQLTRPGPARDQLAALLDPLADKPELLETLHTFMAGPIDRRQTAASLRVHPNTVDYRLRKVAALTGLDTSRPADLPTIRAALAARRAAAANG
ncbi:helix-turn-helix domain-containing protein [Streptomyces sp. B1866]|uniref:PucR family transcriptional regulator n=1 Tax=Streptomyces sp. B1866 TaxID=3075431 RepID=UPI00288C9F70|nr:helix-turn-helix domain-containing protein [Streptomyces sp. B1866]MDT3398977.1 helix-turn-helix domain-containing protein [Streptomyces sp. B1866]